MSDVTVTFDVNAVLARKEAAIGRAQAALDVQVIKDANAFCPEDVGTLRDSALLNSRIGSGVVKWVMPYASRLYYNPQYNFSKDKNPNARGKWFEEAKARFKAEWLEKAKAAL